MSSLSTVPRIQVFRPTMEEFKDFSKYIEKIESEGANKAGLAKIIPPEGWCPRKGGYDDIDLMIPAPIRQEVTGRQGLYQQINVQSKALHVKEFQKLTEDKKYKTPPHFDYEDLERKYWKNITFNAPIYGADVSGSLYDPGVEEFNIKHLNTILDMVKQNYEIQIEGVNTAYLYFGMWKTTFAWHTEDMDLYSINYLHFGAPKSWYVVPPEHGRRLERLAAGFFHGSQRICSAFLRHKMTIISPHILKKFSIPCSKITQEPGEFMITFPFAYHSGFNHGFNCAESTNFALPRWIEYGKRSSQCTCRNDCVKICMDVFVRKFQPERYELWLAGKDVGTHPEDPSKCYAAPPPNKCELAFTVKKERVKNVHKIKRHPSHLKDKMGDKRKVDVSNTDDESEHLCVNEKIKKTPKKKKIKKDSTVKIHKFISAKSYSGTNASFTHLMNIKSEDTDNPPPELKPFWDHGDKMKQEIEDDNSQAETIITGDLEAKNNSYCHNTTVNTEIFDKFPQLKNRVANGTLSVQFLDEDNNYEQSLPKKPISSAFSGGPASFYNYELSNSIFAQNWRCEQVDDGLKIKLVSPKTNQSNIVPSSPFPKIASVGECSVSYANESDTEEEIESQTILPDIKLPPEPLQNQDHAIIAESTPEKQSTKEISCNNDSGHEANQKVKRAANSKDNWAHHLNGLWQHENCNFEIEQNYNQKLASIPPHCSVCVIFTPLLQRTSFPSEPSSVPLESSVRMPAFCYGDSLNNECILDTNSLVKHDGTAPLLSCSSCKICVHVSCYGITELPTAPWMCNRCSLNARDAQCCLCVLRGGALKATTDGRWAHIVCAILISESYFENTQLKEGLNVSGISSNRQRLKCKYCNKAHAYKDKRGICIQCQSGKCYLPFHATCGYMAGVIFESRDWPDPINIICTKHSSARRKTFVRHFTNVSVGESVIAKHKNKRYYWANVKRKFFQEYYSILFEDNSHSKNTLPEDIVSKDVAVNGPPGINEKVRVKWTDGKIYNGIFKGSQTNELFVVEFDDGTVQQQERKEIYAADEELPKEVQSKMSHSSEKKSLSITASESKRSRLNQKYYAI